MLTYAAALAASSFERGWKGEAGVYLIYYSQYLIYY
jgi:hypothetical protein